MSAVTQWVEAGFRVSAERRGVGGTTEGGDFFTVCARGPGRISVVIGDTCGRGDEGAEHLAKVLPTIHALAMSGASPAALLMSLNRIVAAELPLDRFITAAAFDFDMRAGTFTLANAAHVPAIVRRGRDRQVSVVGYASGTPLGIVDNATYAEECHELSAGDVVVLMTDGTLEAIESDLLRMSTLRRLLAEASEGVGPVYRALLREYEERTDGADDDDMTLMALEPIAASTSWAAV